MSCPARINPAPSMTDPVSRSAREIPSRLRKEGRWKFALSDRCGLGLACESLETSSFLPCGFDLFAIQG